MVQSEALRGNWFEEWKLREVNIKQHIDCGFIVEIVTPFPESPLYRGLVENSSQTSRSRVLMYNHGNASWFNWMWPRVVHIDHPSTVDGTLDEWRKGKVKNRWRGRQSLCLCIHIPRIDSELFVIRHLHVVKGNQLSNVVLQRNDCKWHQKESRKNPGPQNLDSAKFLFLDFRLLIRILGCRSPLGHRGLFRGTLLRFVGNLRDRTLFLMSSTVLALAVVFKRRRLFRNYSPVGRHDRILTT